MIPPVNLFPGFNSCLRFADLVSSICFIFLFPLEYFKANPTLDFTHEFSRYLYQMSFFKCICMLF